MTVARAQARTLETEIASLRQQEQALVKGAEEVKNSLNAEQQVAVPAAHQLVDRRSFSWSRLLVDLEASLPPNVRVTRIGVRDVTKQGDRTIAGLELVVFTKNPSTISEMITAMHEQGIFQPEIRAQNLSKGRGEAGTEYELYVVYRPRPGYAHDENVAEVATSNDSREVAK